MILPVGGNEGKAWTQMPMELWYLTTTMNALPRTMREPIVRSWDTIGYNMKLQMLLHRREVVMKNKTKRALSALVSSRSLGEQTAVESQINCLYLTSWCRNHNTVLGSKSCIRRTQCHQDALWQYGFFCLPTPVLYKMSTKASIQMMNRGEWSYTSNLHAIISLPKVHSVAKHWLLPYHICRAKGMYQFWALFWMVSVQDWNSVFGDIGATHADVMEAAQYFVRVYVGIHGWGLAATIHV